MYLRQNGTQEFLGDLWGVSQPTVSRIVTTLVPAIKAVLEEFVPTATEAIELVKGRVCLVDGTITPCWSYAEHKELWSRKHGTTGFNAQLVSLLDGTPIYVSDPLPGKTHDKAAFDETPVAEIVEQSGGGIGDKGYQGTSLATPRKIAHLSGPYLTRSLPRLFLRRSRPRSLAKAPVGDLKSPPARRLRRSRCSSIYSYSTEGRAHRARLRSCSQGLQPTQLEVV